MRAFNVSIKAALHATAALLVALTVSSPAARAADDTPSGWIVVSLTRDKQYGTMEISIKPIAQGSGGRILGVTPLSFGSTRHQFSEKVDGYVKITKVPPGQYHITNFHLNYAPSKWTFRAKSDFSVPFEVKANEVAYLGEFLATATMLKNSFLIANIDKPYFLVSNQQERDMPIAVAEHPELKDLPVAMALTGSPRTPFLRATRMAEEK